MAGAEEVAGEYMNMSSAAVVNGRLVELTRPAKSCDTLALRPDSCPRQLPLGPQLLDISRLHKKK
jgi:hypothetical protein